MTVDDTRIVEDVEAAASIVRPLQSDLLAGVLETSESAVVEAIDRLESEGRATTSRHGVSATESRVSQSRYTLIARRLADALDADRADPMAIGAARWAAGQADAAHAAFVAALGDPADTPVSEIIELAIASGREARVPAPEIARLLVRRAQDRRNRGDSDAAMHDLDEALPDLGGEALVDGLGFASAIHDDQQRPSDAERTIAMAMSAAAAAGLPAKLGSLLTLHGRMLSRLGFDTESEDAFRKGLALVDRHGDDTQRYFSGLNQAWTDLDRGWVARAEQRYTVARARSEQFEGPVATADKDIALARAHFLTGDGRAAEERLSAAEEVTTATDAPVLRFLRALAEAEGAIAFGQPDDAVEAADRFAAETSTTFPQWTNRAATVTARALLLAGRHEDARTAIATGVDATPPGANGLRLRTELQALELMAADSWNAERATDVADRLLQGGWMLAAVGLLTERARREGRDDLARTAAALAHRIGAPLAAAEAVEAGGLWDEPSSGPITLAIRRVATTVPERWSETWRSRPAIEHALSEERDESAADEMALAAHLDDALATVGLGGTDVVLSPAQRRSAGLVTAGSAVRSAGRFILWLVGVAAVAAVVAIAVQPDPVAPPTTLAATTTLPTTTTLPPIPARIVDIPDQLAGQAPFAGGDTRNALFEAVIGEPTGVYWRDGVTGFVDADPVLRGRDLYIGTSQGFATAVDILGSGSVIYESRLDGAITAAATIEQVQFLQDDQGKFLAFVVDDRGTLLVRHINDSEGEVYRRDLGSPATGPPLVRSRSVIVATEDGLLLDLNPSDGVEIRRFPAEGEEPIEGGFDGPLAADDGSIYARTGTGEVVVIDEATLTEVCRVGSAAAAAVTMPVVAEGRWLVGTSATTMRAFAAGGCSPTGVGSYQVDAPILFPPVVADGIVWAVADAVLIPIDLETGQAPFVASAGPAFTSPLVLTQDLALISLESDELVAFDRATGEEQWRFDVGNDSRQRAVVGNGLIIVATTNELIAIAAPGE